MHVETQPLTPARWRDFTQLFGKSGACAGCWCMWWRLPHRQWLAQKGDRNRAAMRKVARANRPPGILAYVDGQVAGWCAVAPRIDYPRLSNSRVLRPVDSESVWSVTCFFVARRFRRQGLTTPLLNTAVDFARAHDANLIEGYPTDSTRDQADAFVYTGLASTFRLAKFREVARRSPTRPIFRRRLKSVPRSTKSS